MSANLAVAHWYRGAVLIFLGRPKEGLASIDTSIRLDPRNPFSVIRLLHITCGLYFSGEYEATVDATGSLIRSYPDFPMVYRWSAAALGQLGRKTEAKDALDKAMNLAPAAFNMYAQSCAVVSAGRPRSPARWAAQSRLGGVTATRRLAATAQNLSSGDRRGDRVSCRKWGGMRAAARRQGRVGDGRR